MNKPFARSAPGHEAPPADEVHISSLLVHCQPEQLPTISTAILSLADAEIHASDPCGKLIVTLETGGEAVLRDRLETIGRLAGVLSTSLVYHQVEQV